MLSRLVEFSLTQRVFTLLVAFAIAALGSYAFRTIPIDAFPNISPVQVKLIMKAPGMTPEEVETRVIAPLEMELLGIPGQTVLRSMAKYAVADITLDFNDSTDIYWARQQVAERLSGVRGDLPESVTGGLAPRYPTFSCSPLKVATCRWPSGAACSTGPFDQHCARSPALLT